MKQSEIRRSITILLVDSQILRRIGLSTVLSEVPEISIVGEIDTGTNLLEIVQELKPVI